MSSLVHILHDHHVPLRGAILGRGLLRQVGSNVLDAQKPPDVAGSISLPLKPIGWIPASVGFSMSLWLHVEPQHCLLCHETEAPTEWSNDHRGMGGRWKLGGRARKPSLLMEFDEQDEAASVMIVSCGVDRCTFGLQAVQRKGSLKADLVSQ